MKFKFYKSLTRRLIELVSVAALLSLSVGCATPIGVSYVDRRVAYESLTTNVISTEKISSFSARKLINFKLYQEFEDDPQKALADLRAGKAPRRAGLSLSPHAPARAGARHASLVPARDQPAG